MYKRFLAIFFLLLLISITAEGAFHHHDDGHIDEDCSTCLTLAHNATFIEQDNSKVFQNQFNDAQLLFPEDTSFFPFNITTSYSERAPPA